MQALRVAIVLQSPEQPPDWCTRLAEQIRAEPRFELSALLRAASGSRQPSGSRLVRLWNAIERRLVPGFQPGDAATSGVPVLLTDDGEAIERLSLDVILDLSGNLGRDCETRLARHGVWFPDFLMWETGAAGLAAVTSGAQVTTISLFRRTGDGCIGISTASLNTKFIAARNELFMCEKAVPLIMRELRRTCRFGAPAVLNDLELPEPRLPGVADLLKYLVSLGANSARIIIDRALEKIGMRPGMFFLKTDGCGWSDFDPARASAHISAKNSYYADPFLWERGGSLFCFFEEYDYQTARGHIGVGRFSNGALSEIKVALRTDYHLSFPFVFEHSGDLYMMPETSQARRLEVWKCREFPDRWELHATALEGTAASDSTLNLIDGAWWLFTNISTDPFLDMNSELHVFRADGPDLTRLEPHSVNPVVLNSRQARNGGRVLELDGRLYRPSQDNSHGLYGYGLRLMEILRLSLDEYEETEAKAFEPDFDPAISGCHHFDVRAHQVVMDARMKIGGFAGRAGASGG